MARAGTTTLLVDDDPNDVLLFQRALSTQGLEMDLRVLDDGEDVIAYLGGEGEYADRERHPLPVLILLDLKLPRKTGFDVLQWLRARPDLSGIPVVMLTSSDQPQDIERAYALGASSYLVKPVGFGELKNMAATLHRYWLALNELPPRGKPGGAG